MLEELSRYVCKVCGESSAIGCMCNRNVRQLRLHKAVTEWIGERLQLFDSDDKPFKYLFGSLTFGCGKCGLSAELCRCFDYVLPGVQGGRKKFTQWCEDINDVSPLFSVDKIFGAEERGSENHRLHYHFIARLTGSMPVDLPTTLVKSWGRKNKDGSFTPYGMPNAQKIEYILEPEKALKYVAKYASKDAFDDVAKPFYFFEYEPQGSALV